jgi:hypothetical protein
MSFASGATFIEYSVLRPLGSDEMGDVYLAQHPRLPRWNTLKILSATLTDDLEFRDRFMRGTVVDNPEDDHVIDTQPAAAGLASAPAPSTFFSAWA